jgi:hypothetical protein
MVSTSVFVPVESPYDHTSDALWTLWRVHDRVLGSAVLSGTYAAKGGYHDKRNNIPSTDYSSGRDVQNDDEGPGNLSSGLDVSMNETQMIQVTTRLWNAAVNNDPRLKWNGEYILREFIGTKNGTTVHCWVFVGGIPLGVGSDQGSDPGRDKSHLWHVHYSVIRKFLNHMAALMQIASIAIGETLAQWRERMEEDEVELTDIIPLRSDEHVHFSSANTTVAGAFTSLLYYTLMNRNLINGLAAALGRVAEEVNIDPEELAQIKTAAAEGAQMGITVAADDIVQRVLAGLDPNNLSIDEVEQAVRSGVRDVLVQGVEEPQA